MTIFSCQIILQGAVKEIVIKKKGLISALQYGSGAYKGMQILSWTVGCNLTYSVLSGVF